MCEVFFSKAGYAFGDRRRAIWLSNIEKQLFLNGNDDFWGVEDVHKVV